MSMEIREDLFSAVISLSVILERWCFLRVRVISCLVAAVGGVKSL